MSTRAEAREEKNASMRKMPARRKRCPLFIEVGELNSRCCDKRAKKQANKIESMNAKENADRQTTGAQEHAGNEFDEGYNLPFQA